MNKEVIWEDVCDESVAHGEDKASEVRITHRLKVPGGWLYRYRHDYGCVFDIPTLEVAMAFVPEPAGAAGCTRQAG